MKKSGKRIVICICGSLFAAAEGREAIYAAAPHLFSSNDWVRYRDDV